MKVSIITVVYNSVGTIRRALESVSSQDYPNIEHIVVDGASTDGTTEIIKEHSSRVKLISEKDDGLYDAMNKGISLASGDIIGILNADDFFFNDNVITRIVSGMLSEKADAIIADVLFVNSNDENKIIRKYSAKNWKPTRFAWGFMPPHPSFFAKRTLFEKHGLYRTNYTIGADYELLIRLFLIQRIKWSYLPMITTKMLLGGISTKGIKSVITLNKEIYMACKENGIYTNYVMIYSKYLIKPFEFIFHE